MTCGMLLRTAVRSMKANIETTPVMCKPIDDEADDNRHELAERHARDDCMCMDVLASDQAKYQSATKSCAWIVGPAENTNASKSLGYHARLYFSMATKLTASTLTKISIGTNAYIYIYQVTLCTGPTILLGVFGGVGFGYLGFLATCTSRNMAGNCSTHISSISCLTISLHKIIENHTYRALKSPSHLLFPIVYF